MDTWWAWPVSGVDPLALVLRVTVLFGLAMLMTWGFRGRAATTGHALWTTTFVVLAALPFAMYWLPTLDLIVLPSSPAGTAAVHAASEAAAGNGSGRRIAMAIWALGSLASLLSLLVGWGRWQVWTRTGRPMEAPEWTASVDRLRHRLGIRRRVRLVQHGKVHTPMVGGVLRPVVLLPEHSSTWTAARRNAVLTHELIHVRRLDALRQLLGGVVLALYWFHPLSWWAARRATLSREQACDEKVLQLGARPSVYAGHLLDLAAAPADSSWRKAVPATLALPLVQRSQLERRIEQVLQRRHPKPRTAVAAALCALLILCGVATAVAHPTSASDAHAKHCPSPNPIPD